MTASGTLLGIGVGPGDPDLVTVKALAAIRAAPVVAYPQLGSTPSFARSIVAAHLHDSQTEIVVRVPLGDAAAAAAAYDAAADVIATKLSAGSDVAALCEGDPLVYGSFISLLARLKGRFRCEIIPGVSSLTAAPARLVEPLASGDDTIVVMPATLDDEALETRIALADTAVILKVGRHLDRLSRLIERLGLTARALYIERATLPGERQMRLADSAGGEAPYFSIVLVSRHAEAAG